MDTVLVYYNDCSKMVISLKDNTISNFPLSLVSMIISKANKIGLEGKRLKGIKIKEGDEILGARSHNIRFEYKEEDKEKIMETKTKLVVHPKAKVLDYFKKDGTFVQVLTKEEYEEMKQKRRKDDQQKHYD